MEDKSIIAGFGKIAGHTVAVIGHNKGKDIKERVLYNFGSSMPQGYAKANRIMSLADRFNFPVITLIDTPGLILPLKLKIQGRRAQLPKAY